MGLGASRPRRQCCQSPRLPTASRPGVSGPPLGWARSGGLARLLCVSLVLLRVRRPANTREVPLGAGDCCPDFSRCGGQGLLFAWCGGFSLWGLLLLQSAGSGHVGSGAVAPGLRNTDSVAVAHGLGSSGARGIFLYQGLNPRLLRWQADSLPLNRQGGPRCEILCKMLRRSSLILTSFCKARLLTRFS